MHVQDEVFGFCRFSRVGDNKQVLYTTVMRGEYSKSVTFFILYSREVISFSCIFLNIAQGGSIVTWDTSSWRRLGAKQIIRDAISAFNVSADGKLIAM